jgi:lysophospholipase L1-like esterase
MSMTRKTIVLVASALLAATAASAQTNFSLYVALGDSLTAGFTNGSLVQTHQAVSYPALLARQAGVQLFQQPLVTEPGIPTELALISLLPSPVIAPKAATVGAPANLALPRPYDNLAVPGATSVDCLTTTTGGLSDIILRGMGTQVEQAVALRPTFITLWIGAVDVLGAVINGQAVDGVTMVPLATFRQAYGGIIAALATTGGTVVAANLPDPTLIPFANTIPPVVVNPATGEPVLVNGQPVPLLGPSGPVPTGSLVTLAASPLLATGVGIPVALGGNGQALPDQVILDPAEIAAIRDRVSGINQAIQDICSGAGIPVLDLHAYFDDVARNGIVIAGIPLNTRFLSGGLFGYDGVHPTDIGYALVANQWIAFINAQKGASLPLVDLSASLFGSSAQGGAALALGARSLPPSAVRSLAAPPAVRTFEFTQEAYDQLRALYPPLRLR